MTHLKAGDTAPEINAVDQNGDKITLEQYKGKKVVLYFYPKDMTPGCTAQSCNLSENYSFLQGKGYDVLGVSCDSIKRHQKFIEKYNLAFSLVSDEEHKVVQDYGVWGLRNLWGESIWVLQEPLLLLKKKELLKKLLLK